MTSQSNTHLHNNKITSLTIHTHSHTHLTHFFTGIYAFVVLKHGVHETDHTVAELKAGVRKEIGGFAVPDFLLVRWKGV